MGMSNDYEIAIEEGATMVRVAARRSAVSELRRLRDRLMIDESCPSDTARRLAHGLPSEPSRL